MSNIINFITRSSLYLIFGLWSSIIVQENNYNTKMKDIDAIVQDMTNKYDNLVEKKSTFFIELVFIINFRKRQKQ